MKQRVYYYLYAKTKRKWLSSFVANIAGLIWIIVYNIQKSRCPDKVIEMSEAKALEIIEDIYPKPDGSDIYYQVESVDGIDLSIIIPVYNYKDVIEECIQSVLAQNTHFTYEVIIVDDGSTDGAGKILKEYQNYSNVKVIFQENAGIGAARNTGLNHASGEYIMFVDCDDVLNLNIVEKLMQKAKMENMDMVMCGHTLVRMKNGEVVERKDFINPENHVTEKSTKGIYSYAGLPWAKVWKRKLFEDIRFLKGYWYEDTIFHFLVFPRIEKYAYIPEALYDYRWYEKNFSHTQGKSTVKSMDRYWMLVEMLEKRENVKLSFDDDFYKVLIEHMGNVYSSAIVNLGEEVQQAMFVAAYSLLKRFDEHKKVKLPYFMKQIKMALLNRNFSKWMLACRYQ